MIGTLTGVWKVRFLRSGRALCDDHDSRKDAIDAACRRWLEDPQVWITGPHGEVVENAEVERIYRERYSAIVRRVSG
jgi:hypothetical protein